MNNEIIKHGKFVFSQQAKALEAVGARLGVEYSAAVLAIQMACGKIIVMGVGKSGLVARKIASTFASISVPALFISLAEATHGDLGAIHTGDIVIIISNSGEGDEIEKIIPVLITKCVSIIGITSSPVSTLGKNAEIYISSKVEIESCPNNLMPTCSTTVAMVIGDAIASALVKNKNISPEEFAKNHPGGSLGRRLYTVVRDEMQSNELPIVKDSCKVSAVVKQMNTSGYGIAIVLRDEVLVGVISDGDLRRLLASGTSIQELTADKIMNRNPKTVFDDEMVYVSKNLMQKNKINNTIVIDRNNRVVGIHQIF